MLFSADLSRVLPTLFRPSAAPDLTAPVAPGDQTRRFRPADLIRREARPGTRPLPVQDDMPSRLLFEATEWEGARPLSSPARSSPAMAERFAEFMTGREAPETVFLNSPGGSVVDALIIGRQLRGLEANTAMSAADICLSACPYLLAAGVTAACPRTRWWVCISISLARTQPYRPSLPSRISSAARVR